MYFCSCFLCKVRGEQPQWQGKGLALWSADPWQHRGEDSVPGEKKMIKKKKKFPVTNFYLPFSADRRCLMGEMGDKDLGRRERDRETEGLGTRETLPKIGVCRQQEGTSRDLRMTHHFL